MPLGDGRKPRELVQYRLLRKLESHSLCQVWEAIDALSGRRVAVQKMTVPPTLPPSAWPDWAAQVSREANLAAELAHPNIAAIHEVGIEDGRPFLVLSLPSGQPLHQRLRSGALGLDEAARVLAQTASALDAVHALGVVHGNVSSNCLLLTGQATVTVRGFWTEPARESSDDLWALGLLLQEMLATPPGAPKPPGVVQAVIARALAREPDQRYPSAGALAEAFQDAVQGAGEATEPPRRALSLPRITRPVLAVLAGVSLLCLLAMALYLHRPEPPLPPPIPFPVSAVLPVPQTPDTPPDPSAEDTFTPLPPRPVRLPVTKPPAGRAAPAPRPRRKPAGPPTEPDLPYQPSPFDNGAE